MNEQLPSVEVRQAANADVLGLLQLAASCRAHGVGVIDPDLNDGRFVWWVAIKDGRIVGAAATGPSQGVVHDIHYVIAEGPATASTSGIGRMICVALMGALRADDQPSNSVADPNASEVVLCGVDQTDAHNS